MGEVNTGKPALGGSVFRAPVGTTLPTTATAQKDAAFKSMGYISEDGVTNSSGIETTDIKEWGGKTVLTTYNSRTDTFALTFISSRNEEVLKDTFGDGNVTIDASGNVSISVNNDAREPHAYCIDMIGDDGKAERIVIPKGAISAVGDITYKSDTAIGYNLTITALADDSDNTYYNYKEG